MLKLWCTSLGLMAVACGVQPSAPRSPAAASEAVAVPDDGWRRRAAGYLDGRVEDWLAAPPQVANVDCAMNCHTTFPAVLAHASLPADATAHLGVARERFEARLSPATPLYGDGHNAKARESHATEAVLNAAALVLDDTARGGSLSPASERALRRMWSLQRDDGAWPWLDFGLEPWEHGEPFGVAMAALAAGRASADGEGVEQLRAYAQAHLHEAMLHDRAALLWASSALAGLLSEEQAAGIAQDLEAVQNDDGSVALGRITPGRARRGTPGDGYATALATLAWCSTGQEPQAAALGRQWLVTNQDRDGSWPGRSVNGSSRTAQQYMTDAATAYAVMALECEPATR